MKVCSTCGDTYQDFVDFCFNDGEVLVEAEVAVGAGQEGGSGARRATPAPSMMATPVPRDHRRSPPRPGRPAEQEAGPGRAQRTPNVPSPASTAATVPDDDGDEEAQGPSAASLAMTQPMEIAGGPRQASANRPSAPEPAPMARPQPGQRSPAPAAATFESELEEPDNSRLLLFGIAAALFGVFLLVAAGVVVVGTTTGLFGTAPTGTDVAIAEPLPIPAPLPRDPLPSLVEPAPVAPAPTEALVQPVPAAPAPVEPAPAPVPAPVAAPAPVPGEPEIPAPAPAPVPLPKPVVSQVRPAPAPGTKAPAPAPAVAAVARHPVSLSTSPPGAAIYLGGSKVLASTPGTIDLEPGTYTLEARLANHTSSTAAVTVVDGPVTASFAPLAPVPMVRVTVMWAPAKDYPTEVTVDGTKIGCPIPCTTPMTTGDHVLRVVNLDGTTFEKSVSIGSGPTAIVTLP